ncbi:Conserved_hypothetical protein [Hexamita inflata]|uniref:Uncharacterized protein n=1 Tax=Hexamita inflata TaxID=28002 RepID=A0ABP1HMV6_9EUKA
MLAMLFINVKICGLDAPQHIIRMRNNTYPITATGFTSQSSTPATYPSYDGLTDTVTHFVWTKSDALNQFALFDNTTSITINQFPLAVVLNYTHNNTNDISQLSFKTKTTTQTEDNGAVFDIKISNQKHKRIQTNEPWFNFDYWYNVNERYNYVLKADLTTPGTDLHQLCGTGFSLQNGSKWNLADSRNQLSIIPMWYIGLEDAIGSTKSCASDYDIEISINKWFCFAPLIVRQVPYHVVQMDEVIMDSDIIVDFSPVHPADTLLGYNISQSIINRFWLTKHNANKEIYLNISQSTVKFFISSSPLISFYGQSGNKTTATNPIELYQTEVQINNFVGVNTIIIIEPVSGQTIDIQPKTTVAGVTQQTIYIGSAITITFIFEDGNRSIQIGGQPWQVEIV